MEVPGGCYQVLAPFGVDVGGTNAAFAAFAPDSEFDSWLTIGVTDGADTGLTIGFFDLSTWTESAGISEDNAAIFFFDPATMGANSGTDPIVMAQLTLSAADAASGTED